MPKDEKPFFEALINLRHVDLEKWIQELNSCFCSIAQYDLAELTAAAQTLLAIYRTGEWVEQDELQLRQLIDACRARAVLLKGEAGESKSKNINNLFEVVFNSNYWKGPSRGYWPYFQ